MLNLPLENYASDGLSPSTRLSRVSLMLLVMVTVVTNMGVTST
jgi:hypothetical protein